MFTYLWDLHSKSAPAELPAFEEVWCVWKIITTGGSMDMSVLVRGSPGEAVQPSTPAIPKR